MPKRSEMVQTMREKGLTYEEIGGILGITRQAAYQSAISKDGFRSTTVHKVRFIGLRNWMLENRVGIRALEKQCGMSRLHPSIIGNCDSRKKTIDSILAVTGLTYEECFKEDTETGVTEQ